MKYITPKDLLIFEQYQKIEDSWRNARLCWLELVKKAHAGKIQYEDTESSFNDYINLCEKWQRFREKHADVLLAKVVS
jgi:hypothetical protein